jgi:hypothetical protein
VALCQYDVSKSFRTESIMKYRLTTINTCWEATQSVTTAKLTRLTHKIATQLHLVAESCTICSSRSRRPVRKLLDTPSYVAEIQTDEEYCTMRIRWTAQVARTGTVYKMLVGNPEQKMPLGGTTCRCKDNIRMDLREIGWEGVDWIHLPQDRTSGGLLWTR